jgi:DNA-binding MarR family transcriptional regulator
VDAGANVVGALALVLADRQADAIGTASGQAASAATALSALHHFLDRPSIERLRQVLGLTHSGAVRLVDRLAAAGYVERAAGADARGAAIVLTDAGRAAAVELSAARADLLEGALSVLTGEERDRFVALAGKVLGGLARGPGATRWICRLCDTGSCGNADGRCPARQAAVARLRAAADAALPPDHTPGSDRQR